MGFVSKGTKAIYIFVFLFILWNMINRKYWIEDRRSTCSKRKFKSWEKGLVTTLQPQILKDCQLIIGGSKSEIDRLNASKTHWKNSLNDSELLVRTSNCSWVKENFHDNLYTTKLELSFPIAFSFVIYNSPQQVMRLLKLLYRPHNQYCISPDKKSGLVFMGIFSNLAKCLDNVHIASTLREVKWGHPSLMESQMCCYKDLMKIREKQAKKQKWRYVINLCGKELPLTTNHEIVSHLAKLNGTSMIEAEFVKPNDTERRRRRLNNTVVPYSIPFAKSSTYMCLSAEFINFMLTNSTAVDLYNFFRQYKMPEEHYYATLYMLPNIPGGFRKDLSTVEFIISRYHWVFKWQKKNEKNCKGKVIHQICIVEAKDLNWVLNNSNSHALFHNKYFMENDHIVMDCMEEKLIEKNKLEYENDFW